MIKNLIFLKKIIKLIFFSILNYFDALILKINFIK